MAINGRIFGRHPNETRKERTFVRADGAEIAWQNYSGANEMVVFQPYDALGAGYRSTTDELLGGWNADGAPGEFDPMGSNAGEENPYVVISYPDADENCYGCQIIETENPMYVNGMSVRATLDGFPISHAMAFNMLETGSSESTYFNWKAKYGGMTAAEIKRLRELEEENRQLKRMYADVSLQNQALKDLIEKKGW